MGNTNVIPAQRYLLDLVAESFVNISIREVQKSRYWSTWSQGDIKSEARADESRPLTEKSDPECKNKNMTKRVQKILFLFFLCVKGFLALKFKTIKYIGIIFPIFIYDPFRYLISVDFYIVDYLSVSVLCCEGILCNLVHMF